MASKFWVRTITVVTGSGLLLGTAWGQSKGAPTTPSTGGGTTGGSTGTPTTGTTRPSTNTPSTTSPTQPSVSIPQPIYVSGRVMLEDGTPPPGPVVIETVCNGNPHGEGYSDAKGYFSIELGNRNGIIQDASEMGTLSPLRGTGLSNSTGGSATSGLGGGAESAERKYMGCDLQAKLSGYRSQSVPLAGRRPMDDPNIGTILMHRTGPAEEGKTVSMVSLAAPKDAKKAYDKGLDALKKKKFEDAQTNFEKAVEAYPKYATAWYELGMLQAGQGKLDMARKYFETSIENDPKFLKPYLQLSIIALQAQKWQELAEVTSKTIKLDPFDFPQQFFLNSVANYNMQHFDAAEKSALEAERLDTRHQFPKNSHLLGMILAMKKDYSGAKERFKAYLQFAPDSEDAPRVRTQLAEVEKITAATNRDQ